MTQLIDSLTRLDSSDIIKTDSIISEVESELSKFKSAIIERRILDDDLFNRFEKLSDQQKLIRIRCVVEFEYEVNLSENNKQDKTIKARQIAQFLTSRNTSYSLAEIGYMLGKKDYNTARHSIKVVLNDIETNKGFKSEVESICNKIGCKL